MRRYRLSGALGILAIGVALAQNASSPWTVTVTPPNPLRIGICQAVQLTVQNAAGTDVPRNKQGQRISMADFDMSVSGASVAGQKIDDYHFVVCGCQGGMPGTVAKVKATYPAKALSPAAVVDNVHIEREASFSVGAVVGQINPPACTAPSPPPSPPASAAPSPAPPTASSPPAAPSVPNPPPSPTPVAPPAPPPAAPAPAAPSPSPSENTSPAMPDIPDPTSFEMPPGMPDPLASPQPLPQIDASQDEDPLTMFAKLMPVFSHPRCVNCHGGTIPDQDVNHGGGEVDVPRDPNTGDMQPVGLGSNEECVGCHDLPDVKNTWRLVPKRLSFVGRNTKQLCRQLRADPHSFNLDLASGRAKFLDHLQTDPLIRVAFVGNKGIQDNDPVKPPPMSHQKFIALARHWLEDGEGACANDWNGTITETATTQQKQSFAPAPGGRVFATDTRIAVKVLKSKATAAVNWSMRDFTDAPTRTCATYNHHSWSALKNNLTIELTIVINNPTPSSQEEPDPPAGMALPPGIKLPPGITMPTSVGVGASVGENFLRYTAPSLVPGQHRTDMRTLPGCQQKVTNDQYEYHVEGAMVGIKAVSKAEPNHFKGRKVTDIAGGTRTIEWDLTRTRE